MQWALKETRICLSNCFAPQKEWIRHQPRTKLPRSDGSRRLHCVKVQREICSSYHTIGDTDFHCDCAATKIVKVSVGFSISYWRITYPGILSHSVK